MAGSQKRILKGVEMMNCQQLDKCKGMIGCLAAVVLSAVLPLHVLAEVPRVLELSPARLAADDEGHASFTLAQAEKSSTVAPQATTSREETEKTETEEAKLPLKL